MLISCPHFGNIVGMGAGSKKPVGKRQCASVPCGGRPLHAGERLPPDVGDPQPRHLDRPLAGMHGLRGRRREPVAHQAGQHLDPSRDLRSVDPRGRRGGDRRVRRQIRRQVRQGGPLVDHGKIMPPLILLTFSPSWESWVSRFPLATCARSEALSYRRVSLIAVKCLHRCDQSSGTFLPLPVFRADGRRTKMVDPQLPSKHGRSYSAASPPRAQFPKPHEAKTLEDSPLITV
jgi:hypothetical protein